LIYFAKSDADAGLRAGDVDAARVRKLVLCGGPGRYPDASGF